MAELAIRSISGKEHSLKTFVTAGRAVIVSVDSNDAAAIAQVAIRGYDASRDLLYAVPNGKALDREQLEWELDLHVPAMLSLQTEAHWFASCVEGYVLIQPVDIHQSACSPLEALCAVAKMLSSDQLILQCDEGSLLAMECSMEGSVVQAAGIDLSEFAAMDPESRARVLPLRKKSRILLSGAEVTDEALLELHSWRSHAFEKIGQQHLLACADIDADALNAMHSRECEFTLMIGAAAVLATEKDGMLVVR